MKNSLRLVFMCLFVAGFLFPVLTGNASESSESDVVAIVGNKPITIQDVQDAIATTHRYSNTEISAERALEDLVNGSILFQEAVKMKIHERKEIRQKIDTLVRNMIIAQLIAENVTPQKSISLEESRELYEQNWRDTRYPRVVNLSSIFIEYGKDSDREKAKKYAEEVRKRMIADSYEDTKKFVDEIIKDMPLPDSININWYDSKDMILLSYRKYQTTETQTAQALKEGEVTDVLPVTISGKEVFAVYKLTKDYVKKEVPFEKVSSDLMMSASEAIYQEELNEFIEKIKKDYPVEYKKDVKTIPVE